MKVVTFGIVPPPYGGVSIHIARLKEFLTGHSVENIIWDISKRDGKSRSEKIFRWLRQIKLFLQKDIIYHLHFMSLKYLALSYFYGKIHKIVFSFHNERFIEELNRQNLLLRSIRIFFLNSFDCVIVDNNNCEILARSIIKDHSKIKVIPEFIPPGLVPKLDSELILDLRKKHKFIISSNAFEISFHKQVDLYGIDLLIEMMNDLCNKNNVDAALIFLLPNIKDYEYYNTVNERIIRYRLQEKFVFITKPLKESSSLWKISDLVVRATNTDGNSLTIHEALSLGIPVVASDCVERPTGVQLFTNRSAVDLTSKVCEVLQNLDNYKTRLLSMNISNNGTTFLNTYKKLIGKY